MRTTRNSDERGMALVLVMLITVAAAALVAGAIFLTSSSYLISKGQERSVDMRNAADAGIEVGRSVLNGNSALFPDSGYTTYQSNTPVYDASGNLMPGVTRSIYYGPTGNSTGQYGIFGSVLSVITDNTGAVVVRRGELAQESFAQFAYYSNSEGSGICFGDNDQIWGPMHTNDNMCIYSSGVHFHSSVEVTGTITGASYGTFDKGYIQHGAVVPLPTVATLSKLATQATQGGMNFTAPSGGSTTQSRLRIEFLALDQAGTGRVTDPNDGFFRVYIDTSTSSSAIGFATASDPSTANQGLNCGDFHVNTVSGVTDTTFYTAWDHYTPLALTSYPIPGTAAGGGTAEPTPTNNSTNRGNAATYSLQRATSHCFLGGDDHLNVDTVRTGGNLRYINRFKAADKYGYWVKYTSTPDTTIVNALARPVSRAVDTTKATRQTEAQYLWPLARVFNPNSKGVIYVTGNVVVSGVVQGQVTLASSGNVMIVDDLKYAIPPQSVQCVGADMLGLLAADSIYVSDNVINTPQPWGSGSANKIYGYTTTGRYLQGVLLTLQSFSVENYGSGPTSAEPCGSTSAGRGCLFLTGGIIQGTRGAVGTTSGSGYIKQYSYDECAYQTPPPYFPTTGRFYRNRYYELDPVNFTVSGFFASLNPK